MALLTLNNIGKIYVSENNVSVGIRGVNLTMDRGEFIAVTGKSGSGKSTLLNVLSGMDTYEEGELLIEGEPTSHYLQKDWEEYRQKYVSFIFQDYNIIESFTVLQNVELALMHIENKVQRRKRAMELIERVGLTKHLRHKGSKLSGGQKQRTVIARALAKDSPIILADEPTGNLDSQTSAEIIELLREVSKEKLVVVVTHNFEQVETVATRHIRIFDGAVEADETILAPAPVESPVLPEDSEPKKKFWLLSNGRTLGLARFFATPKLSVFLCILMLLTALVITLVTSLSSDSKGLFDKNYMFTHISGRDVIVREDGAALTDAELEDLAARVGASSYEHYDFMLDQSINLCFDNGCYDFKFGRVDSSTAPDVGRLPEKENEVMLVVPVSLKSTFGDKTTFTPTQIPMMLNAIYTVTGVKYQVDNTKPLQLLFSDAGYRTASALAFFETQKYNNMSVTVSAQTESKTIDNQYTIYGTNFLVDFDQAENTWFITGDLVKGIQEEVKRKGYTEPIRYSATLSGSFQNYQYNDYGYGDLLMEYSYVGWDYYATETVSYQLTGNFGGDQPPILETLKRLSAQNPNFFELYQSTTYSYYIVLSPASLCDFLYNHYYKESYTQASLFFANDKAAEAKVKELRTFGYIAVPSNTTATEELFTVIFEKISMIFTLIGWMLTVVFSTMFINLCSSKAMSATQSDIAIMRSMGISTPVIKVGIFFQTLLSLLPAYLGTGGLMAFLYLNPATNAYFSFLHWGDYFVIAVAMLLINLNLSRKYIRKMFHESVKKSLRGGNKE